MSDTEVNKIDDSYPPEYFDDDREKEACPHCGKEYEEFSDLGCEHCDRRHPGFLGN